MYQKQCSNEILRVIDLPAEAVASTAVNPEEWHA